MRKIILCLMLFMLPNVCLAKDLLVLGADWCPACVKLKQYLANNRSKIKFKVDNVNIDKNPKMKERLKVKSIPASFIFDDDGNLQSTKIGFDSSYTKWLKDNE